MMEKQTNKQIMAEGKKDHLKNSFRIYGGGGRREARRWGWNEQGC